MKEYLTKEMLARSVANEGDAQKLIKLMKRAEQGERISLCFLGGSITQGSLATEPTKCYSYLVYDWFVKTFPESSFIYTNAGIGGTTSQFGMARLDEDVFPDAPDFCMVEFSVNDTANVFFEECYEAVIRRLLYSKSKPALLILNNLFYESGTNAQKEHNAIAENYCIPALSVLDTLYPEIEAGRIVRSEITPDNLHPNDDGHAILAGIVTAYLDRLYDVYVKGCRIFDGDISVTDDEMTGFAIEGEDKDRLIPPLTMNAMENVKRLQSNWCTKKAGDSLSFTIEGSELAVQYRKTIKRPAPVAVAILDGDEEHPIVLDANFDEDWGDSIHIDTILYHGIRVDSKNILRNTDVEELNRVARIRPEKKTHTLEIRIIETHEDERSDFCLYSIIAG